MSANHPSQFCRSKVIFRATLKLENFLFCWHFNWKSDLIHSDQVFTSKTPLPSLPSDFCTSHIMWTIHVYLVLVPYSSKLSREKTFVNFAVLWLYVKVFSTKFGAWCPLGLQKRAICESFLRKNHIFHQFVKVFSLESFPLYGISGHKIILKTQKQGMNIASMETYNF